ncbi:MAG: isoprenylcysteine carboxylmethyltransferase family protein [Bacteroidales bacterium]|nr:isoprenylcysteine carboxylmethyltransferase family protein [Bacteroidales bacterium]MCF8404129.1 isoprenylcysteine carboxylmethyltransferase family protein [Bacteroidales bacterium]
MALQEEFESQGSKLFKYRGSIPIFLLATGIVVFVLAKMNTEGFEKYIPFEIYEIACISISFIGLIIRILTVGFTPSNTSGRNTGTQMADVLNTTGIYSTVRHPLYVGNFFMWLGIALLVQNFWYIISFVLLYWVYYERIMFAEEQFLRRKFGEIYLEWAKKTPAFIPSFKNFVSPNLSFSWKKILKKEKNGFSAIFVVFFIFRLIGDYVSTSAVELNSLLAYLTAFAFVFYFVLKYLKKYTSVLDESDR